MVAPVEDRVLAVIQQHLEGANDDQLRAELPNVSMQQLADALNKLLRCHIIQVLYNPADNTHKYVIK